MGKSYIKLYNNEEDLLCAELHTNGKYKIIKSEDKMVLLKLAGLINRQDLSHEGYVRNEKKANKIIDDFEKFRKLQITITHLGKIPHNKIILKSALAGTLTIAGISFIQNNQKEENDISYLTSEKTNESEIDQSEETIEQKGTINELDTNATFSNENDYEISESQNQIEETFNFSYESRNDSESMNNVKQYSETFNNVANDYGLDANLLMAIAAQESGGLHYENLYNGPAAGIMQIEKAVHLDSTASGYNFTTGEYDNIYVDENALENIETNIRIAAMIFRACLKTFDYNIPIAIQAYNFGPGSMYNVLSACSELENISTEELINDQSNNKWLYYREFLQTGDCNYVEHVLSYLNSDKITVLNDEGQQISVNISNDYEKGFTH